MASKTTTNATSTQATTEVTKARLNPGEQWIGLNNLVLDERFQPRSETNLKWSNILSDSLKSGGTLPPIDVFQLPDGRLIVASGFHRYTAARLAGETDIRCVVRNGTEEDAIVFAAGSNADADGKRKMSDADITKAVEMLLAIDAWWNRSDSRIANHVGCSSTKIKANRSRISIRDGREMPETIERTNGTKASYRPSNDPATRRIVVRKRPDGSASYGASYKGAIIRGSSPEAVRTKLGAIVAQESNKLKPSGMHSVLVKLGFAGFFPNGPLYRGLRCLSRTGSICVTCDFSTHESLPLAIGRLIAGRRFKGDLAARMIVLCYPEDGPAKVIDLYKQEGFEFLSPEELAESLKAVEPVEGGTT